MTTSIETSLIGRKCPPYGPDGTPSTIVGVYHDRNRAYAIIEEPSGNICERALAGLFLLINEAKP